MTRSRGLARLLGLALIVFGWPTIAWAAACDGIEEPLAFNACLAKHGGMVRSAPAIGHARGGSARGREVRRHGPGGRMRMEFDVAPTRR